MSLLNSIGIISLAPRSLSGTPVALYRWPWPEGFRAGAHFLHSQFIDAVNAHVHVLKDPLRSLGLVSAIFLPRDVMEWIRKLWKPRLTQLSFARLPMDVLALIMAMADDRCANPAG